MAEYYPLISRAVAGLRGGAPEARQAIYSRAKQALVAQLRGMQPPVPEPAIDKEIAALDEAVARIEAELTAVPARARVEPERTSSASPIAASPIAVPQETPAAVPPMPLPATAQEPAAVAVAAAPSISQKPAVVRPPAPPVMSAGAAPARSERAVFERRATLPAARPLSPRTVRPTALGRTSADADEAPLAEPLPPPAPAVPPEPSPPSAAPAPEPPQPAAAEPLRQEPPARDEPKPVDDAETKAASLPTAPTLAVTEPGFVPDEAISVAPLLRSARDEPDEARPISPVPDILAADVRSREEGIRPAMPRQPVQRPRNLRVWIVAVAALAAVVAIALTAWKLKDNPEELARVPPSPTAEPAAGKIVERADGASDEADPDTVAPPTATATAAAQPTPQAATAPSASPQQPVGDQAIAVSYKAAILVSAPDTPEKVKAYVGTVVWRTESVPQGQDQPLGTAVRADIDVPEAKVQAVMELRKNTEAQFPASHTIDLKFTIGPGSPLGAIKQIDVPRMRSEDANPTGDPLIGVPVTITNNYFLVGLTRGAAEKHNVDALRNRGWIDVPMVLENGTPNGTPAKITFEKGASGDRIVDDALAAWSRS